jgi:hypothetical protein
MNVGLNGEWQNNQKQGAGSSNSLLFSDVVAPGSKNGAVLLK